MKSTKQMDEVSKGVEDASSKGNKYKCKQCPFNTNVIALIGRHIIQNVLVHSGKFWGRDQLNYYSWWKIPLANNILEYGSEI